MSARLTLVKIEDHEGSGSCSACGREGLRWVARLSDGSPVGLECSKPILGYRPAPRSYSWIVDYVAIAEHTDGCGDTWVLWRHRSRDSTSETCNGGLRAIGGAARDWERRGWLAGRELAVAS